MVFYWIFWKTENKVLKLEMKASCENGHILVLIQMQ